MSLDSGWRWQWCGVQDGMTRRKGELVLLLEQLARAPWWVSVVLAVVVYIGLGNVLPSVVGGGPVVDPIVHAVSGLAWLFAGIFLLPAAVSAFRVVRGRRMLAANRTKESIRELGWEEFEELIEAHYRRFGFSVRREGGGGADGGVDLRITKPGNQTYLVQCKQWRTRRVGVKVVRELFGVVAKEHATGGIVVTAGSFTREAEEFANGVAVELVDGNRLQDMMRDLPGRQATAAEDGADSAAENISCPRCGSALVLRTARRGSKRGSRFYGCSSYPQCRFTRPC